MDTDCRNVTGKSLYDGRLFASSKFVFSSRKHVGKIVLMPHSPELKEKSETADGQTKDLKISELLNSVIFKPPIKAPPAQTVIVHIANQRFKKV